MGQDHDREHFKDYRAQTLVKHRILSAYLPAYFRILKKGSQNLLFIDAFAGRGTYTKASTGETFDGSPLRALKLIAEGKDFAGHVSTIFIESDGILFSQLAKAVDDFYAEHNWIREPVSMLGTFADRMSEILQAVEGNLAPTFLFVDPCGVSGADFNTIGRVMNCQKCESFIFLTSTASDESPDSMTSAMYSLISLGQERGRKRFSRNYRPRRTFGRESK